MLRHTTGLAALDAREDFARARRGQLAARWLRRVTAPRTLKDAVARGTTRLEVVPLREIVGTVEPSPSFDARFRPASPHVRFRWERVALAHRRGVALPPIRVLRAADGYYVADGRHRVSVALALGLREIDAWVTQVSSRRRHRRPATRSTAPATPPGSAGSRSASASPSASPRRPGT